jgi:hypothetical protein
MEPKRASPMVPLRRAPTSTRPHSSHHQTILPMIALVAASSLSVQESSFSLREQPRAP